MAGSVPAAGASSSVGRGRAWLVWSAGLLVYVVAVAHRSSFGVAGLAAQSRFGVAATVLSLFVVIQLSVYAAAQVPVGIALDRFGPRALLTTGSVTMAVGQLGMTLSHGVPTALAARVLIGAGDAMIFVSAVRLVAAWFPRRLVPLLTQLTGIVGQLGQIVSAIPFAFLLHRYGWEPAFGALAGLGGIGVVAAVLGVRDRPAGTSAPVSRPGAAAALVPTLRAHGTWLGFWSHMLGGFSINVFGLMWGYPFLVQGQGLTPTQASSMLALNVLVAIVFGPLIGEFTARHPLRRSWAVLVVAGGVAAGWLLVLVPSTPRPFAVLVAFVILISLGGPASVIGLDFAATSNPPERLGSAQGLANAGGFLAGVLVMLGVGIVLDARNPGGHYTLGDYRAGLALVAVPWAVSLVGVLVTRTRTRAEMAAQGVVVPPLREAWDRRRRGRRG